MGRGRQPIRAKIFMSTGRLHHYGHLLQVWKESLHPLTLYTSFHDLINVYSRRTGGDNPRGHNCDVNRNLLSLHSFAAGLKKCPWSLILYNCFFFMILYMYIAPGQGLTNPWGRNCDVNRNILSLWSFVASLKKISLKSDFIQCFLHDFIYVKSPGAGADNPRGQRFDVNRSGLSLHSFAANLKKMSLKSDFIHFFFMI